MTQAPPLPPARAVPLPRAGAAILLRALFKRAGGAADGAFALPDALHEMAAPDAGEVARYNALLGFAPGATPLTFFYLPTQRAHLAALLAPAFPFRVVGMVHVENALRALRPLDATGALRLLTRARVEAPTASGARFVRLETTGSDAAGPVFSCTNVYLAQAGTRRRTAAPDAPGSPGPEIGGWDVNAGAGRAYARVSGDWNPIHLADWSARLLGMPAPIIHGMHSVGRIAAAIEARRGAPVTAIAARFRAPVPLRSEVRLHQGEAVDSFVLMAAGRRAVECSVETGR